MRDLDLEITEATKVLSQKGFSLKFISNSASFCLHIDFSSDLSRKSELLLMYASNVFALPFMCLSKVK